MINALLAGLVLDFLSVVIGAAIVLLLLAVAKPKPGVRRRR